MIPSENFCGVLQREIGYVADDINGNMPCERDICGAFLTLDVFNADVIALGDIFDDLFRHECRRNRAGDDTGKDVSGGIHRDASSVNEAVSAELFDDAFQLADVALYVFSEEVQNIIGEIHIQNLSFALQNGDTELRFGWLDIHDQTAFKSALNALFQVLNVLGRTVRGQYDLFACIVERVERVEELFLRGNFTRNELNVVDMFSR